jgi:hypothetical protein
MLFTALSAVFGSEASIQMVVKDDKRILLANVPRIVVRVPSIMNVAEGFSGSAIAQNPAAE